MRPLQAAIRKRGEQAAWFLHGPDPSHLKSDERLLHSVDEVKKFNPRAVFVPGNWVPDFFPGVKVQVFHGFGIEKKGHFDIRGFFDLYCTHGPLTTGPFQTLAKKYGYFHVIETGWPKMDALFKQNPGISWKEGQEIDKPVVLYAPTFSPSLGSAPALQSEIERLSKKGDLHWQVKFHPLMDTRIVQRYRAMNNRNLQIIDDPDIIPYLRTADVMLTDTSSVVAEFLLLKKPVVTFRTKAPARHMVDFRKADELEASLQYALNDQESFMPAAEIYIEQMHPYFDGKSSERVLDATETFINQYQAKMKTKPLNLYRKLKIRHRLEYYHLR
jgi:CDP-glycerol glycerophosphotransferase (TagB/SpsB family)